MEKVNDGSATSTTNARKRNLLFLTGNKKTCLQDSVLVSNNSECDTKMESTTVRSNTAEKRKIVSGSTINIDISEKVEIRLGQMHAKKIEYFSLEDEEKMKEDSNDIAMKKRRLPDLKPIAGTLIVMNRPKESYRKNLNSGSEDELRDNFSTQKTFKTEEEEECSSKRRRIVSQNVNRRTKWKCKKCSFQHSSKEEVVSHVRNAHKSVESNDADVNVPIDRKTNDLPLPNGGDNDLETGDKNIGETECNVKKGDTPTNEPQTQSTTRAVGSKAYGCEACPYTTGCKSQFINHARFHRPNNGDFKCKYCTYNVTHKHLLLQHVRVHGVFDISSENVTDVKCNVDTTLCPQYKNESSGLLFSPKVNKSNGIIRKLGMVKSTDLLLANRRISEVKQYNLIKSREMVKTKIYLCTECPARFFEEKLLKAHNNFHSTNFRMKCNVCSYSSVQKEHLASHMKVHSKVYQIKTRKLLTVCTKSQLQSPMLKKMVGESVQRLNSMNDNIKSSPTITGSAASDSVIYCEKCPSKFLSGILYRQHSVYHGKLTDYKCEICNFGTDTNTELAIHKLIHAGSDVEITKGNHWMKFGVFVKNENVISPQTGNRAKYYKCNKCPFEFSKRDRYELHLKQHGSNQKYTCTICDFSVNLYVNYVQHLKKHDSSSAFDISTTAKLDNGFLADSSRSSSQNTTQLYKCDTCPFYSVDEKTVNLHKQKHEPLLVNKNMSSSPKEEPLNTATTYACSYCDFTTSTTNLLQEHEELHNALSENQAIFENDSTNPDPGHSMENVNGYNGNDLDIPHETNGEISSGDEN